MCCSPQHAKGFVTLPDRPFFVLCYSSFVIEVVQTTRKMSEPTAILICFAFWWVLKRRCAFEYIDIELTRKQVYPAVVGTMRGEHVTGSCHNHHTFICAVFVMRGVGELLIHFCISKYGLVTCMCLSIPVLAMGCLYAYIYFQILTKYS